jgi:site-specific recombinase XerD
MFASTPSAFSALQDYLFTQDFPPTTQRWYHQKLQTFLTYCSQQGVSTLDAITAVLLTSYLRYLRETPSPHTGKLITSQTLAGHARAIKAFLRWAADQELVKDSLPRKLKMPRTEQKVLAVFTPAHMHALFAACEGEEPAWLNERNRAIVAVLLDTGMRASELCGLTLDRTHLGLAESYVVVRGKGSKQREIALGKKARTLLHRYITRYRPHIPGEAHVFLGRKGPLTPEGLDRMLYRLRDKTNIVGVRVSAHTFRHSFAFSYMANGGDVLHLSRILGHTDLATTQHYLRAFSSREARQHHVSVLDNL